MAAIYQHTISGRYRRFDSHSAAQLWLMSPGNDGFATANDAAATANHNDSLRVYRQDSIAPGKGLAGTNAPASSAGLLAYVQEQINQYSVSKLIKGSGANISAEDWDNDRNMRERCAKAIGDNCPLLASDDTLLALAGDKDMGLDDPSSRARSTQTEANQAEFKRGQAAADYALQSQHEGGNSHEAQARANAETFNASFAGSDYRAGLK